MRDQGENLLLRKTSEGIRERRELYHEQWA